MAGSVGGEKREGRGSNPRPPKAHRRALRRPGESTVLGAYVAGRMYLIMAVTGLGYLALTWSTVVLLGGFVSALQKKDFWCLTTISMLQAASIFNDLRDQMFFKLLRYVLSDPWLEWRDIMNRSLHEMYGRRLTPLLSPKWSPAFVLAAGPVLVLFVLFFIIYIASCLVGLLLGVAFYFVMLVYGFLGPIVCFALALWRILQPDYGDTDGDASKGNLKPALMMFYWLILCQLVLYLLSIIVHGIVLLRLVPLVSRDSMLTQEYWGTESVIMYLFDTEAKCWREGDPVSISGRSLSRYAADLLDLDSWEDNLFGARMLATFIRHGADVRSLLLPSRPKIHKLINTLGWRGRSDREMRECAAGIVAHLAGDIHISQFPGALRCISSLLQLQDETYWDSDGKQVGDDGGKKDNESLSKPCFELFRHLHNWFCRFDLQLQDETYWDSDGKQVGDDGGKKDNESLSKPCYFEFRHLRNWLCSRHGQRVGYDGGKKDGGCNKLILQGLAILERLASSDHHNCSDIYSAPGLLHMITAPLYSGTFSEDINMSDWAHVVNAALKVVYQLISHAPKDISTRLRLDISSNPQSMSNLKGILDQGTGAGLETQEQLLMRAMEILTELALDSSVDLLTTETKDNLIKKQLQIFLDDQGTQEPGSRTDPLIVTAGRTLVLMTSTSKTNPDFILKACDSDNLALLTGLPDDENTVALPTQVIVEDKKYTLAHLTELLDATNNITYRTIAAEILESFCTNCDWNKHKQIIKELLLPKVVTGIRSIKCDEPEGKVSDEKEKKPQSRMWTRSHKNNRGNQKNFVPPGKDIENQKNIVPGVKSMIQEFFSSGDQKKSSDEQNKEKTAKKELQEALLSLALVICDKLISADDVVQEKALGGDAFVVKLKTIIDENCRLRADSLRIVKLCGQIAASMMKYQPYAERFRNKKFSQSLTKASEIMSHLESCMIFARTNFGRKKAVRPLLSELEKKVSDLEQKEVHLVRR